MDPLDPNPEGESDDVWYSALSKSCTTINDGYGDLASFVLTRGLFGTAPKAYKLIGMSFETVHTLLSRSRLNYRYWDTLDSRLPSVKSLFDWDKCERLRKGTINRYASTSVPLSDFLDITQDKRLFSSLVNTARAFHEGRRLLAKIEKSGLATPKQLSIIRDKY